MALKFILETETETVKTKSLPVGKPRLYTEAKLSQGFPLRVTLGHDTVRMVPTRIVLGKAFQQSGVHLASDGKLKVDIQRIEEGDPAIGNQGCEVGWYRIIASRQEETRRY